RLAPRESAVEEGGIGREVVRPVDDQGGPSGKLAEIGGEAKVVRLRAGADDLEIAAKDLVDPAGGLPRQSGEELGFVVEQATIAEDRADVAPVEKLAEHVVAEIS